MHTELLKRVVDILEKNDFVSFKANFKGSVYGSPSACYGQVPDITAHDSKNRFYIVEVPLADGRSLEEEEVRCKAFAKYAGIHHSNFWVMVEKGREDEFKKLAEKWGVLEGIKLIKGI